MKKNYIIYTNEYDENTGGVIVLHQLCHLLNQLGFNACLWPAYIPVFNWKRPRKSLRLFYTYLRKDRKRIFKTNKFFNTPIATKTNLKNAVTIYSEVVIGNPLNAKNVVRWLLHKPGYHTGKVDFTPSELTFGYSTFTGGSFMNIDKEHVLYIRYIMSDIYKQTNFSTREGYCHLIRKGKGKTPVHPKSSVLVDNLSHEEISKIFNKSKYFISYDPYTFYSTYASMCGCISIVIPDENVTKDAWYGKIENTYGLSYGMDDIEYADETKELMFRYIAAQEGENMNNVDAFAKKCEKYFSKKQKAL